MLDQPSKQQLESSLPSWPLLMVKAPWGNVSALIYRWSWSICPNLPGSEGWWCWWHITHKGQGWKTSIEGEVQSGRCCRSRGDFLLVKLPSSFQKARREAVQLSLLYPPGYFKKTPRCSTLCHTHTHTHTRTHTHTHTHIIEPTQPQHLNTHARTHMHIHTETAGENITHLTWNSHCTWHVPPILVCSHITVETAAVARSHIICSSLSCRLVKKNKKTNNLFLFFLYQGSASVATTFVKS